MLPQTVLSSATKEVVIGPDHPFAVIGERINPTGRKALAAEMKDGDFSRVEADALAQVAAGATMLDVNAGIPLADEPAILAKSIELFRSTRARLCSIPSPAKKSGSKPFCHWSRNTAARSSRSRTMTRESRRISMCGSRLPRRSSSARKTMGFRAATSSSTPSRCRLVQSELRADRFCSSWHGCATNSASTAPAARPTSASACRTARSVNSTCGASNLSFGLPNRKDLNTIFVAMAAGAGLTSAIVNPLHPEMMAGIRAANVINATDKDCMGWIKASRAQTAGDAGDGRRGGRNARTTAT